VDKSTISRWLSRIRQSLLLEIQGALRERLGDAGSETEALALLVGSQLELSLRVALQSHGGGSRPKLYCARGQDRHLSIPDSRHAPKGRVTCPPAVANLS
jgi:hypothetical protein